MTEPNRALIIALTASRTMTMPPPIALMPVLLICVLVESRPVFESRAP